MAAARPTGKKIGLLGGSFDPVHRAHIALAESALRELALDEIQLIPAADPWQRPPLAATPSQRVHMLQLAIQGRAGLSINPIELNRGGPSYTADTLKALPDDADYYWLLGSDQLNNFCTWHRWQEVADHARLVVAQRPDADLQPPEALLAHLARTQRLLITLPFEPRDISATDIRAALAQARPVEHLLDDAVLEYIRTEGLYRPAEPTSPAL